MWEPSPTLWPPQRRGVLETIAKLEEGKRTILYSPTGGGKTVQATELIRWAQSYGESAIFYVNRRLLIGQTSQAFSDAGITHGIRAADYEDMYRYDAPVQIASADTERVRVIDKGTWKLFDAGLVVVDEAHLQKSKAMDWILKEYQSRGAHIVLLTATPVNMRNWADDIVISGKLSEYRDCKAIVPAVCKCISVADLSKVKRNATGEFVLDGRKRRIFTQTIVGDVLKYWKKFNPDARPTMLYAPGVAESVWFTEKFVELGVPWVHVDATDGVLDGKRVKLTRPLWDEIMERLKDGSLKGLSSRFKAREGINVPSVYHCILATPMGSLASYLQTVGRALRYSPETPDHVIVQDHGGAVHNLGTPNHDRDWATLWRMSENAASKSHRQAIKDGRKDESIVCPECLTERVRGRKCPVCGFEHDKRIRRVIMEDGTIEEVAGKIIRKTPRSNRHGTDERWTRMYFGFKNKRVKRTWNQMEAFFFREYGYYPPKNRPYMPRRDEDWNHYVYEVKDLYHPKEVS